MTEPEFDYAYLLRKAFAQNFRCKYFSVLMITKEVEFFHVCGIFPKYSTKTTLRKSHLKVQSLRIQCFYDFKQKLS